MQTLSEILIQFHDLNRRNLFNKIQMCQLVHTAKTRYGVDYKDFATRTGCSAQSVREYGYLYRFYLPVMEDLLKEIETNETLLYTHLRSAKAGLGNLREGCTPDESALLNAQDALQRLKDWTGLSEDQVLQQVSDQPYDCSIVKEFTCTKFELVQWARKLVADVLGAGQYRVVIYKVD